MIRRLIGVGGLALTLLGCNDDRSRLLAVEGSMPIPAALPTSSRASEGTRPQSLLASRDPSQAAGADDKGDKPPTTAEEAVKRGQELAGQDDLMAALAMFERAHELDPKDRPALTFLTQARRLRADRLPAGKGRLTAYLGAGQSARMLRDLVGKEPKPLEKGTIILALYREATALARDKQMDRAVASLTEAVDAGFLDDEAMAEDPDLKPFRDRPEYPGLVARVKESIKKAMKERDVAVAAEMLPEVKAEMASFKPFTFHFDLPGLDGKPVKSSDFKGKVTIVDIWGTWCPPCRMEIPHFIALRDAYREKGVEIVGINKEKVPEPKVKETIEAFAREMGINYPLVIGNDKVEEDVRDFSGYPTTLFIDREGKVRYLHVGYAPYEVLEYVVKTLLDEKPRT